MRKDPDKKVILEDGQEYLGWSFGADKEAILEIVFNTSMVGYQEILSDPSYTDQAVVMTYPLIGNYGMAEMIMKLTHRASARLLCMNTMMNHPTSVRHPHWAR